MKQTTFLEVKVLHEVDSTAFDGADLKRIARGEDGKDYACKRIQDGALIPISEWMGYHLWSACGLLTPEFSILRYEDGSPPAFGSKIELLGTQIQSNPDALTITGFFKKHIKVLSLAYPLDAFYVNPDRHGRNFMERPTLTDPALLCFDYSRAWASNGAPWGNEKLMKICHSAAWWGFFQTRMGAKAAWGALDKVLSLKPEWFEQTLFTAPAEWLKPINTDEAIRFWHDSRSDRVSFAKSWATSP